MATEPARILLVDDEESVLEALAMALRRTKNLHAEVETARTGTEALDKLGQRAFQLIVADYRMPGMNGADLLAEVRRRAPHAVRVLLTGYTDLDIALEAMDKASIHYYIQKPWDTDSLRTVISDALRPGASP
ncbi:MAG: response regulator [Thermoplasmatota archaeon]